MTVSVTVNLIVSLSFSMAVSLIEKMVVSLMLVCCSLAVLGNNRPQEVAKGRRQEVSAQCWRSVSPGVVSAVRLDEVLVAVLGEEGHQLLVGPVEEGERAAEC